MRLYLGLALACLATDANAQEVSRWCHYQQMPPDTIIARHYDPTEAGDLNFTANGFPSRSQVRFTGRIRSLPEDRRRFLAGYARFRQRPQLTEHFQHEVEVAVQQSTIWLPIQETMLGDFRTEVPRGDTLTVFLVWAGVQSRRSSQDSWVFLINEFSSAKSRDHWQAELATCR